ncbi:restriction endonuclease subunit S [Dickeya zeae]|nr:restriction endonuclease subunit S [Dickeya zeae]
MTEYPTYPNYSPEGIPSTWEKKRLRFVLKMNPSKNEIELDNSDLVSFVPMDAVGEYGGIRLSEEKELGEIGSGYTYFADEDVVVAKITPCFENGKGALAKGLTNKTAFGTTELHVMRTNSSLLDPHFLFYLTISDLFRKTGESEMYGAGGQKRVPESFFKDFRAGLPSMEEQQTITRFLDFKTVQIDALIAKQQALLDKLAEKRTALISHAVTKGLDPSVPMKDSGVAWLGDIPAHWDTKRLKFVGKTRYGLGEPPQKLDGGLPFIRATDIYRGEIDGSKVQTVDPDCVPWSRNPTLKAKDILVVRSGAYTGDSAIVPAKWVGSIAGYDMVYTAEGALPEYIAFNLLSKHVLNGQIYLAKNRAAQPHLNAEELGDVVIALPPRDEQVEIVAYIEDETKRLAIQCDLVNSVVERLHEYRSSMITNAVTGKIDVRGFQIPEAPAGNVE